MPRRDVKSEITGKVWKVEAAPGARLAEDEPILVLESMKMEIPIVAPIAGTLVSVLVAEGDAVREGQTIAVLET